MHELNILWHGLTHRGLTGKWPKYLDKLLPPMTSYYRPLQATSAHDKLLPPMTSYYTAHDKLLPPMTSYYRPWQATSAHDKLLPPMTSYYTAHDKLLPPIWQATPSMTSYTIPPMTSYYTAHDKLVPPMTSYYRPWQANTAHESLFTKLYKLRHALRILSWRT